MGQILNRIRIKVISLNQIRIKELTMYVDPQHWLHQAFFLNEIYAVVSLSVTTGVCPNFARNTETHVTYRTYVGTGVQYIYIYVFAVLGRKPASH